MRLIVSIFVIGWLTSCSITKTIVIYNVNVIPPKPEPKGMSQENMRLIIAETAGTISTIIAIMFVSNSPSN